MTSRSESNRVLERRLTIGLSFGQYKSSLDFWNVQLRNEGSAKTFEQLLSSNLFLNQHLLAKHLAVRTIM